MIIKNWHATTAKTVIIENNSKSVPLYRKNQNVYIIDKYMYTELWLIGKSDE